MILTHRRSGFKCPSNVTLYVTFTPDVWHMAPVPDTLQYTYSGKNCIGFFADECPGCEYGSGTTNATDAGFYTYKVALGKDCTIWSDLSTNETRTILWQIDRAVLTNKLPSVSMTYDWTKSPAENLARFNADMFVPPLPDGVTVEFRPGKVQQVNVRTIDACLDGGGEEPVVEKWLIGKDYPSAVVAYVDANGTLHIKGAGAIKSFASVDDVPWKDETIQKIIMDSTVTVPAPGDKGFMILKSKLAGK